MNLKFRFCLLPTRELRTNSGVDFSFFYEIGFQFSFVLQYKDLLLLLFFYAYDAMNSKRIVSNSSHVSSLVLTNVLLWVEL